MAAAGSVVSGSAAKIGFGSDARWIAALLLLNLLDGVFTTIYLQLQVAEEVNPLMRFCWQSSPLAFMVVKLAVVQLGAFILWLHRDSRTALIALKVGAALYLGIVGWHLLFLLRLLTH